MHLHFKRHMGLAQLRMLSQTLKWLDVWATMLVSVAGATATQIVRERIKSSNLFEIFMIKISITMQDSFL